MNDCLLRKESSSDVFSVVVAQLRAALRARRGARSRARDRPLPPGGVRAAHGGLRRGGGRGSQRGGGPQGLAGRCRPACNPLRRRFGGSRSRRRAAAAYSSGSIRGKGLAGPGAPAHPLSAPRSAGRQVRCLRSESAQTGETSARIGPRAGGKVEGGKERTISKKEREAKEKKPSLETPAPRPPPLRPAIPPPDFPQEEGDEPSRQKKAFSCCCLGSPPFFSTLRPQQTHPLCLLPPPAFTLSLSKHLDRPSIKTGSRASSRSSQSSPSASSPSRAPPSRGGGARSRAPAA